MENAIDLLITGKPEREVAEAVGVTRETIWHWRHDHPIFLAELNRRRQALWAEAHGLLRALVGKTVDAIEQAVGAGDVKAAIELLKAVGMYGDGTMNAIFEQDPEKLIRQQAEAQVDCEGVPRNALLAMTENLDNAAWRRRVEEVEAELRSIYVEDEQPEKT